MLNIPIEVHFVEVNKYEVTVLTAMRIDGFKVEAGQYVVELDGDGSILKKIRQQEVYRSG